MQEKKYNFSISLNSTFRGYLVHDDELFVESLTNLLKISRSEKRALGKRELLEKLTMLKSQNTDEGSYVASSSDHERFRRNFRTSDARLQWLNEKNIEQRPNEFMDKSRGPIKLKMSPQLSKRIESLEERFVNRNRIKQLGLEVNSKLLLVGAPGGGKTTLAHKISSDLNVPLNTYSISSIISSALGGTGKQLHEIFANARSGILFLDEFDAIGSSRFRDNDLGEMRRVVNVLLQEIDNLSTDVFLIAATNFPSKIDPAVIRRFSQIIELPKPSLDDRVDFIGTFLDYYKVYPRKADIFTVSKLTEKYSYADLKSLLTDYVISCLSGDDFKDNFTQFYINDQNMTEQLTDSKLASWVKKNSITITDLSKALNIPRTTLSDRIKRIGD